MSKRTKNDDSDVLVAEVAQRFVAVIFVDGGRNRTLQVAERDLLSDEQMLVLQDMDNTQSATDEQWSIVFYNGCQTKNELWTEVGSLGEAFMKGKMVVGCYFIQADEWHSG